MKKFLKEFKEFINRGNVMDMAVGIIIGGAFTSIVSSLVEDIINPFLGLFGGMNFDKLSWKVSDSCHQLFNYGSCCLPYRKNLKSGFRKAFPQRGKACCTDYESMSDVQKHDRHRRMQMPAVYFYFRCEGCEGIRSFCQSEVT